MPRLAKGRTTQLSAGEIARAALGQFDTSTNALSMRSLAAALGVSPASIYHYFPTEEAVIRAAMALVFEEAIAEFLEAVPLTVDLLPGDPHVLLEGSALAMRRAFLRHFRIAIYIAMDPQPSSQLAGVIAIFGAAFEQLGLTGERAGEALFAFGHFVYGSILISASTRMADQRFNARRGGFSVVDIVPGDAPRVSKETVASLQEVMDSSFAGTDEEERLFLTSIRALVSGLVARAGMAAG